MKWWKATIQFLKTEITADFTWFYLKESPGVEIMLKPTFYIIRIYRFPICWSVKYSSSSVLFILYSLFLAYFNQGWQLLLTWLYIMIYKTMVTYSNVGKLNNNSLAQSKSFWLGHMSHKEPPSIMWFKSLIFPLLHPEWSPNITLSYFESSLLSSSTWGGTQTTIIPLVPHSFTLSVFIPLPLSFSPSLLLCSFTFQEVQDDFDRIWKFQRYELIKEYNRRSALPPPFIFLSYMHYFIRTVLKRPPLKDKFSEYSAR